MLVRVAEPRSGNLGRRDPLMDVVRFTHGTFHQVIEGNGNKYVRLSEMRARGNVFLARNAAWILRSLDGTNGEPPTV